jgi:virginiamycin B lyase
LNPPGPSVRQQRLPLLLQRLAGFSGVALLIVSSSGLISSTAEAAAPAVAVPAAVQYIYWTNYSGTIGRANIDGSNPNQNFIAGSFGLDGIAVDSSHIYWTNDREGSIGRANLDGSGANETFLSIGGQTEGVAVDATHIYWANRNGTTIGRANLDGTGPNASFINAGNAPQSIAVDGTFIYWSISNGCCAGGGSVERANLDGSGITQSFIPGGNDVNGVAVNSTNIYWANYFGNSLGRAKLDGTGATQNFVSTHNPVGITVGSSSIYWAAPNDDAIGRANLDGTGLNGSFIAANHPQAVAITVPRPSPTPIPTPSPQPRPSSTPIPTPSPQPRPSSTAVTWTLTPASSVNPQMGGSIAYSPLDKGVLYYLPAGLRQSSDETWIWDGHRWKRLTPKNQPQLATTAGMVFDSARNQTVLLGNRAHGRLETWIWKGGTWHAVESPNGPVGLTGASLAFDAVNQTVVLFGGNDESTGKQLTDTWLWNGTAWQQTHPLVPGFGPVVRKNMPMTSVSGIGPMLFAGCPFLPGNCFWKWNGRDWIRVNTRLTPLDGSYWMVNEPDQAPGRVSLIGRGTDGRWLHWSGDDGTYWLSRESAGSIPTLSSLSIAFDATHRQIVALGGPQTWTGVEPSWDSFGCGAGTSNCDRMPKSIKRQLGLDPYRPDTAGDGIPDRWKLDPSSAPPTSGAGIVVKNNPQPLNRDLVFGPYSPDDTLDSANRAVNLDAHMCSGGGPGNHFHTDENCVDDDGHPSVRFDRFNHRPDLWHKNVYVEVDWQDCNVPSSDSASTCPGQVGALTLDPLHHAPNLMSLELVIDMFRQAPVINADGSSGINLNILVNDAIEHRPSCAQAREDSGGPGPAWRSKHFGTEEQRSNPRARDIASVRGKIFRYVWSGHSSALPSTTSCPPPGLGPLPPAGDLPTYDWSPFGTANTGGRTIVLSAGILWVCPARLFGCYDSFNVGGAGWPAIYPGGKADGHQAPYPVADLLGFGQPHGHGTAIHTEGWVQVSGRAFAHLLGVSLGLSDVEARNDPTAPGLVSNGAIAIRPPDSYYRWTGLQLAPKGAGKPATVSSGNGPYYPDYNRLAACFDPTFINSGFPSFPGRDKNGRVMSPNDPCVTQTWNWQ